MTMRAANGKSNGRFELPQLTPVNYSLTDGTDIPPPPDSPIEEKAPAPLAAAPKPTATPTPEPAVSSSKANGTYDGRGRTSNADHHEPPLSPASTTRPGSIRRFLSRRSLNSNYTNGHGSKSTDDLAAAGGERPGTSLTQPKRSTSWFRRLGSSSAGGANGHRTSVVYENAAPPVVEKKGPPPPKLPELNMMKAKIADDDEGSLGGGDMFKNIK